MGFWWVSQGKTFAEESAGNYLWAPGPHSSNWFYWSSMDDVQPNDIIFSYTKQTIAAIAVATSRVELVDPPPGYDSTGWQGKGRRVSAAYTLLRRPVALSQLAPETVDALAVFHGALNRNKTGNQGYLFPVSEVAARGVLDAIRSTNGDFQLELVVKPALGKSMNSPASGVIMPGPSNLILYGPPGTGKTYETASEAVRLCDGSVPQTRSELMMRYQHLVAAKRITFVTFHQSYAYEDFVEGLRPVTASDDENADGAPTVGFALRPQDGIFKQIADLARENRGRPNSTQTAPSLNSTTKIFKMSLGRSWSSEDDHVFEGAISGGYVALGYGGDVDWSHADYDSFDKIKMRWRQDHPDVHGNDPNIAQIFQLRVAMDTGSLVVISDGNRRFRAIGEITGPYYFEYNSDTEYKHRRTVRWLWTGADSLARELIYGRQFSQVSVYQLNGKLIDWAALAQIVVSSSLNPEKSSDPESYVLIIDEINRANVSKVFGELITLLEPDKRAGKSNELSVTLPYSRATFTVPANLHVLGTMNTADRSIALLDTALRRRFSFKEVRPDPSLLPMIDRINLEHVLRALNRRIQYLLDRDHEIGHAYFMGCANRSDIDRVMREKVIPLLVEYFFDDWNRIRLVLGETKDSGAFIIRTRLEMSPGADLENMQDDRWAYELRDSFSPEAFEQLML